MLIVRDGLLHPGGKEGRSEQMAPWRGLCQQWMWEWAGEVSAVLILFQDHCGGNVNLGGVLQLSLTRSRNRNADAMNLGSGVREDFCGKIEKQRLTKEKANDF